MKDKEISSCEYKRKVIGMLERDRSPKACVLLALIALVAEIVWLEQIMTTCQAKDQRSEVTFQTNVQFNPSPSDESFGEFILKFTRLV